MAKQFPPNTNAVDTLNWGADHVTNVPLIGSIIPLKAFIDNFEKGSGVINKIIKNSDKTVKHVLTEDDAVEYYLKSIKHLKKDKTPSGRDRYINPEDLSNHYSGDWSTPDAKMFASFASKSQCSNKFNDILTGIFLDNGLTRPTTISRLDVANRPTLLQMGDGVPLKETLLGHSSDTIANNLGGLLGDISIMPGKYNDDMLHAIQIGINPNDYEQMKKYYDSLSAGEKPFDLHKMFDNVTLKAPVKFKQ